MDVPSRSPSPKWPRATAYRAATSPRSCSSSPPPVSWKPRADAAGASEITVGVVVRATETDFSLVECFDVTTNQCRLSSHCRLQNVLGESIQSFFAVLDRYTLADLLVEGTPAPAATGVVRLVPGLPRRDPAPAEVPVFTAAPAPLPAGDPGPPG